MADFFSDCPIPICKIRAWYYGEPLIALADVSTALPTKKEVIRQVLRWIAKDMTTRGSRETYDECVTSIRATCAARLNMTSFAEKLIKNAPYRSFELESLREISNSPGVSSFSDSHELETGNLGVCNIDDCSRLLRACLGSVGAVRVRSPTEQFLRKAVFSIARRSQCLMYRLPAVGSQTQNENENRSHVCLLHGWNSQAWNDLMMLAPVSCPG